jgi:hypothetical protein
MKLKSCWFFNSYTTSEAGGDLLYWRSGDVMCNFGSWTAVSLLNCHIRHVHPCSELRHFFSWHLARVQENKVMLVSGHLTGWLLASRLCAARPICTHRPVTFNSVEQYISFI